MIVQQGHKTVATFCSDLEEQRVIINREYQRMPGVWPRDAQSFLIETILLGYPIPKLTLYEHTDVLSRETMNELVDGQQRATAILAFYKGELRLSGRLEFVEDASACLYEDLSPERQGDFLSYSLGFDSLVDTTPSQIREIFRRINSYEMPLNAEEQRHARFQGALKWLIYRLARRFGDEFKRFGTFSEVNLIRMQDMKLLAELAHALRHGITTTSKSALDRLYREFEEFPRDTIFPFGDRLTELVTFAVDYVASLDAIFGTQIMKQYSMYSLLLAIMHAEADIESLRSLGEGGRGLADRLEVERRLGSISAGLDDEDSKNPGYDRLRLAFSSRTNVKDQRETRFRAFLEAVSA